MWLVFLIIFQFGPTGETLVHNQVQLEDIQACQMAVKQLTDTLPDPHTSYYVGCMIKPAGDPA
jgi:hypothetical protein